MLKIEVYETGLKEYNYAFTICFCINMERVSLYYNDESDKANT